MTDKEKAIYSELKLLEGFPVVVKNEVFNDLREELDSIIVAAKLLDYDLKFSYAKSHVRFIIHFTEQVNNLSKINLVFSCQNEIRELDYITLQIRNSSHKFNDVVVGYSQNKDDYNISDNIFKSGLHLALQETKRYL